MKRAIAFSFLLSCCGYLLADAAVLPPARQSQVLEEIVRLTRTGATYDMVLAFAQAHRRELPSRVSDGDLQWLRQSGVSDGVVRYLRAIDVRIPDSAGQEGVTYGSNAAPPPQAESEGYDEGYADDGYVGYGSAPSGSYDNGDSFYDFWYTPYFNPYPYAYYPSSYYPYYPYYPFHVYNSHGFHGHDGHHVDHHSGHDDGHGHWRDGGGHDRSGDAWRNRGMVATRRSAPMSAGSRGSARPAVSRGNFASAPRGARGGMAGHSAPGRSAPARGGMSTGGARGGGVSHGGFGHGGFSGNHSGGGHSGGASSGGHGHR